MNKRKIRLNINSVEKISNNIWQKVISSIRDLISFPISYLMVW